jgi:FkbM family methyltransferase
VTTLIRILKSFAQTILEKIPQRVLSKIEEQSQLYQGKGWGAATTEAEVAAIAFLLTRKGISSCQAFDVGANIGDWTQSFIQEFPQSKVIAFEPGTEAFKVLSGRFKNMPNVECVNLGLSDNNAEVTLFSDAEVSGLSSLHKRRLDHFAITFDKTELIRVVTLDSWITSREEGGVPLILKLDVEGHELSALSGATETLKEIELVQFEFGGGNIDSHTYFQDFWYFFANLDFDLYRLTPRGPVAVSEYSELLEVFRPTNYFAVRR